mgnify:CR=1 FL=1
MKKKLLSILLVLSLMLALVPAAFAVEPASGTCGAEGDGSNVTWTIDKNGVLTVTGTGAITSDAMQIRQLSYRSDVTSAVIGGQSVSAHAVHQPKARTIHTQKSARFILITPCGD